VSVPSTARGPGASTTLDASAPAEMAADDAASRASALAMEASMGSPASNTTVAFARNAAVTLRTTVTVAVFGSRLAAGEGEAARVGASDAAALAEDGSEALAATPAGDEEALLVPPGGVGDGDGGAVEGAAPEESGVRDGESVGEPVAPPPVCGADGSGVADALAPLERVDEGDAAAVGEAVGVRAPDAAADGGGVGGGDAAPDCEGVPLGEGVGVVAALSDAEGDAPRESVEVGVPEDDGVGEPVGEVVPLVEAVSDVVLDGETGEADAVDVEDGDAPGASVAVGVDAPLGVVEGVG
jgi:hypothetical protein